MADLWRRTERYYCDAEEVVNTCKIFGNELDSGIDDDFKRGVYCGVHFVFDEMRNCERMAAGYVFKDVVDNEFRFKP